MVVVDLAPADTLPRVAEVDRLTTKLSDHQTVDQDSSAGWSTLDSGIQARPGLVETLEPDDSVEASVERLTALSIHC